MSDCYRETGQIEETASASVPSRNSQQQQQQHNLIRFFYDHIWPRLQCIKLLLLIGLTLPIVNLIYVIGYFAGPRYLSRDLSLLKKWVKLIIKISGIKVVLVKDHDEIDEDTPLKVTIVNHQNLMDWLFITSFIDVNAVSVVKSSVFYFFFPYAIIHKVIGCVSITRSKPSEARAILNSKSKILLAEGRSIAIFPEGTRNSNPDQILPFKLGAFHIAKNNKVPIRIFVIGSLKNKVNFPRLWLDSSQTIFVKSLPLVPVELVEEMTVHELSDHCRKLMNEAYN